jgi:hypothetical protein
MTNNVAGRLAARRQARRNYQEHGGGDRKGGRYFMGLRLKLDEHPTRIHLQRPETAYQDPTNPDLSFWWKTGMSRFIKTKRFKRGIPVEMNMDGDDLLDAYAHPGKYGLQSVDGVADGKWLSKFDPKPYFCVSGWVEEWYHLVQYEEERDGQKVSWHERVRCVGRDCENCQEEWPKVFGNRFWLDFSYAQWFGPIDAVFEVLERTPKDGGYVYPMHYKCNDEDVEYDEEGNPVEGTGGCGEILSFWDKKAKKEVTLDMTNNCGSCNSENIGLDAEEHMAECQDCNSRWSLLSHEDSSLFYYLSSILKCSHCGHEGYPTPVMAHSEGLEEWECYDLYDVQLTVHMVKEGKRNRLQVKKFEVRDPDEKLFKAKHQGEGEAAKKQAEKHEACLDLEKVHSVMTPEEQAEILELPNLFDPNREARNKLNPKRWKPRNERDDEEEESSDEDE